MTRPAALGEDPEGCRAGGLRRQQRPGEDHARRGLDQSLRELGAGQLRLRRRGGAVERDREPVRRPDLDEGHLRPRPRARVDPGDVDAFGREERANVIAMTIVADGREQGRVDPEAGQTGGDVPAEPADGPDERVGGGERGPRCCRREVDPDPTGDDCLDHAAPRSVTPGA